MFRWGCKMAELPHRCLLPPPCTTIIMVPGVPDFMHETTAPEGEGGLLNTGIGINGFRLTLGPSHA